GDSEQDLTDLVREIGEVAQNAGTGTLFLIDEMHNLDSRSLAAICIAFQAVSRQGLPVAMVGAGLPDLQVRLMAAKPYADRLARSQLLRHPLRDGDRRRAALSRGDGSRRRPALPGGRRRSTLRRHRPARRLRPPRLPDPERPDLEPAPRPGRLHRPAFRGVPAR